MKCKNAMMSAMILLLAVFCVALYLVTSVSNSYMHHDCSNENCFICLCVSLHNKLQNVALHCASSMLFAFATLLLCGTCTASHKGAERRTTPVCLKVKLSN